MQWIELYGKHIDFFFSVCEFAVAVSRRRTLQRGSLALDAGDHVVTADGECVPDDVSNLVRAFDILVFRREWPLVLVK